MKTIALYNIKGGVGKTASCVNLAYLASCEGNSTLLCDLDPQASASFYFRIRPAKKFSKKKLMKGQKKLEKNIRGTDFDNLDLLPADISYRNLDISLNNVKRSKKRLQEILAPFEQLYDYIFLDSPPNITLVSENIFRATDHLLVPIIPTTLSINTYRKLTDFFSNHSLNRLKILPYFSMVEKRKKMHQQVIENAGKENQKILKTQIPYAADVEKMGVHRKPVPVFRPKSKASLAYSMLWEEIKHEIKKSDSG